MSLSLTWTAEHQTFQLSTIWLTDPLPKGLDMAPTCQQWLTALNIYDMSDFIEHAQTCTLSSIHRQLNPTVFVTSIKDIIAFLEFGRIGRSKHLPPEASQDQANQLLPILLKSLRHPFTLQHYNALLKNPDLESTPLPPTRSIQSVGGRKVPSRI